MAPAAMLNTPMNRSLRQSFLEKDDRNGGAEQYRGLAQRGQAGSCAQSKREQRKTIRHDRQRAG